MIDTTHQSEYWWHIFCKQLRRMVICSVYGIFTYMVIFRVNADKLFQTWSRMVMSTPSTGWVVPPCHQNSANKDLSQAQLQRVNMTGHEWFGNGAWLFACKVLQKWLKLLWKLKLKSLSFQIKWIPGGTAFKCYLSTSIALYVKAGLVRTLSCLPDVMYGKNVSSSWDFKQSNPKQTSELCNH